MNGAPSLRVALQTGASTVVYRIFAVGFAFASVCGGAMIGLQLRAGLLGEPEGTVMPFVPVAFLGASVFFHWLVWRDRASDVELSTSGLRVLRGKKELLAWEQIDGPHSALRENRNVVVTVNGRATAQQELVLRLRNGEARVLAVSTDPEEQRSFEVLLHNIQRACAPSVVSDEGPPEVLRCPSCGAPAPVALRPEVRCWRCDSVIVIHEPIQRRLAAATRADGERLALTRALNAALEQPEAAVANRYLLASVVSPYLVPVLGCAGAELLPAGASATMALISLSNLQFRRRAALPGLASVFAARPPEAPGAPLRCRSCAGPLPETPDALVGCPWCEADNVRALSLERPASLWAADQEALGSFLDRKAEAAWWPRAGVVLWGGLTLVGLVYALLPA